MTNMEQVPVEPPVTAPRWLRRAAASSWRLLVVAGAVGLVFYGLSQVTLVFVAVFLALVLTAILSPVAGFLSRWIPRPLATAVSLLGGIGVFAGLITYVVFSVSDQWDDLSSQFQGGINQIIDFLKHGNLPFSITNAQLATWLTQGVAWLESHAYQVVEQAASRAGSVVEAFTAIVLAIFCTIFFLSGGSHMWQWCLDQMPARSRRSWHEGGVAGWTTFSGYTRGTVLIALTDGIMAFVALLILRVPLAGPLAVLVFIGAFIPLIGAPLAMIVAMMVALAANGLWSAVLVGVLIALIGQIEGHVLQPFIMGKQVSLHPVVVALSVACGTLTAGILGAVIAVPLVSVAWSVFSRLRAPLDPPTAVALADEAPRGHARDE